MECEDILHRICDDLAEDIDSEVCQEIKQHLKTCEQCRKQLDSVRNTVKLYQCLENRDVPSTVHSRLFTLLNLSNT